MATRNPQVRNPELSEVIKQQSCTAINWLVPAATANYFKTSTALAAQTTTLAAASMTKSYVTDVPVVPIIVVTNSGVSVAWTSVTGTVVGIDQFGHKIAETIAGVVSNVNQTWTLTAVNAYATLISVAFTIAGGTAADSNDSYVIGFGKTYGLGVNIGASGDVLVHNFNLATDAGTISVANNTYTFAGTPDAAKYGYLYVRSSAY